MTELGRTTRRWRMATREETLHRNQTLRWKGGYPQELVDWYNDGADGQIDWGEDGDFEQCVAVAGKYIDNPEGFCQLRHIDATGAPAGKAPGEKEDKSLTLEGLQQEMRDAADKVRGEYPATELRATTVNGRPTRYAAVAKRFLAPMIGAYQAKSSRQIAEVLSGLYAASYQAGLVSAASANTPAGATIAAALQADDTLAPWLAADFNTGLVTATDAPAGLANLLGNVNDIAGNIVSYMDTDSAPPDVSQATQMVDTEAANGAEIGAQDAAQTAGFDQMQSVPDDNACEVCQDAADQPYDIGDAGPPWHPRCGCESNPAGDADNTSSGDTSTDSPSDDSDTETTSAVGRHVRRWKTRDWAEWDAEHEHGDGHEMSGTGVGTGEKPHIDVALGKAQQSALSSVTDSSEAWFKAEDAGAKVENGRLVIPPEAHADAALALGMAMDRAHEALQGDDSYMSKSEAGALSRLSDKLTKAGLVGHGYNSADRMDEIRVQLEDRYTPADVIAEIDQAVLRGSVAGWELRDSALGTDPMPEGVFSKKPKSRDSAPKQSDPAWDDAPVESVKISDLHPTQTTLTKTSKSVDTDPVSVLKNKDGDLLLINGHHRVVHAVEKGKKKIDAHVIDQSEDGLRSSSLVTWWHEMRDWAQWDLEHPYVPKGGGSDGAADGSGDGSINSTLDGIASHIDSSALWQSAQDEHGKSGYPVSSDSRENLDWAINHWSQSFSGSSNMRAIAEGRTPSESDNTTQGYFLSSVLQEAVKNAPEMGSTTYRFEGGSPPSIGDTLDRPLIAVAATKNDAEGFKNTQVGPAEGTGYVLALPADTHGVPVSGSARGENPREYIAGGTFTVDHISDDGVVHLVSK